MTRYVVWATLAIFAAFTLVACNDVTDTRARLQNKAVRAQAGVAQMQQEGRDPTPVVMLMKQVKPAAERGDVAEAERLLDEAIALIGSSTTVSEGKPAQQASRDAGWSTARKVEIRDYDGDAMEPFITRDGQYLLFNNLNDPRVDTNLHYATRVDDFTFDYRGELKGANTKALEGVPSVARNGEMYFVSPRDYADTLSTLWRGRFDNGQVSDVAILSGDVSRKQHGWLNMDAEISADGQTLYFVINEMQPGKGVPKSSNIGVSYRQGDRFVVSDESDKIFQNINTDELEYAPAVSDNELELFFTRAAGIIQGNISGGAKLRVYRASRRSTSEPFATPELIEEINGFVEGPTISSDNATLYFHKREGGRFHIYAVTR